MANKAEIKNAAHALTRWVGSVQSIVVHTLVFAGSFLAVLFGAVDFDRMLLVLTTLVSLEAIYLAIFIQMTINEQAEDIDEIQEDIDEIQEDVEEIQEDMDEIQEDVEEIQGDVEEDDQREMADHQTLEELRAGLQKLISDVEKLQQK